MEKRKDVIVSIREKGQKLYLVGLEVRHEVGAIANLANILEKGRFSIVSGFVSSPGEDGYGRCSFFVQATEGRPSAAALAKMLEGSKYARAVEVAEAHKGLITDGMNFPLAWNSGDRGIMLRTHFFSVMEEGIRDILGTGGDVLLYQLGYHHGAPTWRDLLSGYHVEDAEDLQVALGYYNATGWGRPEVVSFDLEGKKSAVEIWDNFECLSKPAKLPAGSNFFRGHLAGMFESVYNARVKVVETKCVSTGSDRCEFAVTA
ncbi:MAG: hypothetical protein JRN46_01170 [Nitrososphaerota archaeon]|nr:hypothetical protein [Nitrososphaerota archaeon]